MPEIMRLRELEPAGGLEPAGSDGSGPVADERIRVTRSALVALLGEAEHARRERAEVTPGDEGVASGAICAWNHFENIPTFYNWNNRPR